MKAVNSHNYTNPEMLTFHELLHVSSHGTFAVVSIMLTVTIVGECHYNYNHQLTPNK